ncbi:MAG: thiamine-phosphate kinase [Bryobacteraceae bacterium]|jgi:thiamine-monophosphate kinase
MKEDAWIAAIRRWTAARPRGDLRLGIGDDCAIVRAPAGHELLVTTDQLVEGVHLRRGWLTARQTGWKALARGLSDIAAMGGKARFALLSLALPPWAGERWVNEFFGGVQELARRWDVAVIGGDLTRARLFSADVVVLGYVRAGRALLRSGARPGDAIYVSGALGRAAAAGYRDVPEPRLELGAKLIGKATACMDLSDGLALDLHRMCLASGTSAELDGVLPSAPGATLEQALCGGEDYELLCTLPLGAKPPRGFTRIGRMVEGRPPGAVWFAGVRLPARGWDPFAQR